MHSRSSSALADALGVLPIDLLTFPDEDLRQQLVERSRYVDAQTLRQWLAESEHVGPSRRKRGKK